jgi:hypothetical protein
VCVRVSECLCVFCDWVYVCVFVCMLFRVYMCVFVCECVFVSESVFVRVCICVVCIC